MTAKEAKGNNKSKKETFKPLNPLSIIWGKFFDSETQILYYALNASVTRWDTKETKQFFLMAETRDELLSKLFKKLGYNLKETFQDDLWESQ